MKNLHRHQYKSSLSFLYRYWYRMMDEVVSQSSLQTAECFTIFNWYSTSATFQENINYKWTILRLNLSAGCLFSPYSILRKTCDLRDKTQGQKGSSWLISIALEVILVNNVILTNECDVVSWMEANKRRSCNVKIKQITTLTVNEDSTGSTLSIYFSFHCSRWVFFSTLTFYSHMILFR